MADADDLGIKDSTTRQAPPLNQYDPRTVQREAMKRLKELNQELPGVINEGAKFEN